MDDFIVTVEDVIPVLPAGIYPATFSSIETQSNDNGTFWLWHFLADDGVSNVDVKATTSPRVTPKTKASKFLAGLGVKVVIGEPINFAELVGLQCQLVITINDAGYSRIENVLPMVTKKK